MTRTLELSNQLTFHWPWTSFC